MKNSLREKLESIVVIAIILVLVQTFLEDYSVLKGWSWQSRKILLVTSFLFDLFFSIEFIIRIYFAYINQGFKHYLLKERGWIDFFASVPLLILNSGPAFFALIAGVSIVSGFGAMLNILKVVKAIRIARILRLLRILKIFKQIKYTDSPMAQRHVAKIATIAVACLVFSLLYATVFFDIFGWTSSDSLYKNMLIEKGDNIKTYVLGANNPAEYSKISMFGSDVLIVKLNKSTVYTKYDNDFYTKNYGPTDFQIFKADSVKVYFDTKAISAVQARDNILYFSIVVILVLFYLFYYSPHFAITVSDPIHVMKRGLKEKSYSLEVRVPDDFKDDDVFELAAAYNETYLPMKDRQNADSDEAESNLDMNDFKDMFGEES